MHLRNRKWGYHGRIAVGAALLWMGALLPAAAQTPSFRSFIAVAVADGENPGYRGSLDGYLESPIPRNTVHNFNNGYANDVRFRGQGASNYRGFWSTGTRVEAYVDNAYYPNVTPPSTEPPFGYYVVAGMGSWTRHRFVTPQALSDVFGQFHWHVTGDLDTNLGRIDARLDFAVARNASSFDDLYNPNVSPNIMTRFGPGRYQYTTGVALDTPLDFLFWSSSFWEISPDALSTLGNSPRNLYGLSEFMRTFNMDSIQLVDANGNPIDEWSLIDEDTGAVIWNQNGRVTSEVPEPGTVALWSAVFLTGGMLYRCRRSRRLS